MLRDYLFHESTTSLCKYCLKAVNAKIILKQDQVFIMKSCPEHGVQLELLEEDASYHCSKRLYDKAGNTMKVQTKVDKGCPFDCGICPQHDQHACIGLIEVTTACNLKCPLCYANAGEGEFLSMDTIERMIDFFIDAENGKAEILQISGGEPTLHPQILDIIALAKAKGVQYVMLNTNGVRLAHDEAFVEELVPFAQATGFEVYLQFDGFKPSTHQTLRGQDLSSIKQKAIENLTKYKIPTTLVMTVTDGVNDDEVGAVFMYGLNAPTIRGINYQPAAFFGRLDESLTHSTGELPKRVTLSGVLTRLEKQTAHTLKRSDFIPLPCDVERVAITYLVRNKKGEFSPITRDVKFKDHLQMINNTFIFTIEEALKSAGSSMKDLKTTCECFDFLSDFRSMVPFDFFMKSKEKKKEYIDGNTFRVSVSSFIDAMNFDMKSMQKECVHIITPDLRKIPFSSFNMLYRR